MDCVSATKRIIVGRWLLLAYVVFIFIGSQLWSSVTSDIHRKARLFDICPVLVGNCPSGYVTVVTGSRPNHVPAVAALVGGGATDLLGVILVRDRVEPRRRAAIN